MTDLPSELEGYVIDDWTPIEKWDEYEKRKKAISNIGLTSREYELEIKKIVEELQI